MSIEPLRSFEFGIAHEEPLNWPNKALHRMAFSLRSKAASELGRWASILEISKGVAMKLLALLLTAAAVFVNLAYADTRCRTDSFGNTTCRDDDGNTVRGRTDSFGNETWRYDDGSTVRGRIDSFGNKTYRDDSGNTLRGRTDSFGNETWRYDDGSTVRGRTDSFGNTTYTDDQGNTVRCRTDSFGNTTCR